MQCSLNKDHRHLKRQPQKSWTLYQGFQDLQDKQVMQYPLFLRSNWKMHQRYLKIQSQNVQIFGYVYQSTKSQNHGPVWKTQSFFSKGICTVILWQDYYGKGNLRKFHWNTVGKKFSTGNVYLSTDQEDYSYPCMWTTSNWQARQKTKNRLEKISWKTLTWENQHHSSTTKIWVVLKESVQ